VLISSALAQAPGGTGAESGFIGFVPLILMFVLLWFLLIRPQMKRQKEHKQMVEALQKGDEVVAAGGVVGRITRLDESYVTLEIAPQTEILVQRGAVQMPLPKGTIKSLQ
jgi:preprotein translocase subunit YajC